MARPVTARARPAGLMINYKFEKKKKKCGQCHVMAHVTLHIPALDLTIKPTKKMW